VGYSAKVGIVFLSLCVVTAGFGVGFAHWLQSLYIDATPNLDEASAVFAAAICTEDPEVEGKDAFIYSVAGDETEQLTITLTNTYPGYECDLHYTIVNTGIMPVHIDGILVNNPNPEVAVELSGIAQCDEVNPISWLGVVPTPVDLHVRVLQDAVEGSTYTLTVTIEADLNSLPKQTP